MLLVEERQALKMLLPGMARLLRARPLLELESSGSEELVRWFRECGSPDLLVARDCGGRGRQLTELAQLLRAVSAACPSLAIMMLMHQHTVGALCSNSIPLPWVASLLQRIAAERYLVASAFAESRPGADVLDSSVTCTPSADGYVLEGCKKPCTMSHHADAFLVGVTTHGTQDRSRGLVLVERRGAAVSVEPFWRRDVLRASDSECVRFNGTRVPESHTLLPSGSGNSLLKARLAVAQAEITISCLFQLLLASTYLGVAGRLCELGLAASAADDHRLVYLTSEIEAACMAEYQLADRLESGHYSVAMLARCMALSYNAMQRIAQLADELSRQSWVLDNDEARYLLGVSELMSRHPPSKEVREQILSSCYRPA